MGKTNHHQQPSLNTHNGKQAIITPKQIHISVVVEREQEKCAYFAVERTVLNPPSTNLMPCRKISIDFELPQLTMPTTTYSPMFCRENRARHPSVC
jgi:hypothetical protein